MTLKKSSLCTAIDSAMLPSARALGLVAGCLLACVGQAYGAIYVVNTSGDPGPTGTTSLRQALAYAGTLDDSVVEFDPSLNGSTITLKQGAIAVQNDSYDVAINGPGSRNVTITGNNASGIFIFSGTTSRNSTVSISGLSLAHGNAARHSGVAGGGAILGSNANIVLDDLRISQCTTSGYGGAILIDNGNLTLRNSSITGNYALQGGGGIDKGNSGNVYIYDSDVSHNTTDGYGGGIYVQYGSIFRLNRSLISYNTINTPNSSAYDRQAGGGIALGHNYQETTITNSTIADNFTYGRGGGIALLDDKTSSATMMQFSTISGNYGGYGLASNGMHSTGGATVFNSIIANNFNRGDNVDLDSSIYANHSLLGNIDNALVFGRYNQIAKDPQLGNLADHGGPTLTMLPASTSPVVDAGEDVISLKVDQRGKPRPSGTFADIGAVELQPSDDTIFKNGFDSS